ncbi:MAG: hypothetical protein NXY57DRAFT_760407 [Lentinula lateritia]|nr:MAG: hypothetical protein NXY57DRAFT_760407 [Lentinula lateritia]
MTSNPSGTAVSGDILQIFNDYSAVKYTNAAFLTILIYDYTLTINLEMISVWSLPWKLPKFLFIINRYIVPPMLFFDGIYMDFYNTPSDMCQFVAKFSPWPTLVSLGTVEMILIIRTLAIYHEQRSIGLCLVGLFTVSMLSWFPASIVVAARTTGTSGTNMFTGCIFNAHGIVWPTWIPPVIVESTLCLMVAYKVLVQVERIPTFQLLARDSLIYFLLMFSLLLANLFIFRFGQGFLGALLLVPSTIVACISAGRMMMNLKSLSLAPGATEFLNMDTIDWQADTNTIGGLIPE